jgi:hypothetical protein
MIEIRRQGTWYLTPDRCTYIKEAQGRKKANFWGKGILPLQCRCRMQRQFMRQSAAVRFVVHVQLVSNTVFLAS